MQYYFLLLLLCLSGNAMGQKFNFLTSEASSYVTGDELHVHGYPYTITVWCNDWDNIITNPTTWRSNFFLKSSNSFVKFYVNNYDSVTKYMVPVAYNSYHMLFTVKGYTNPADTTIYITNSDTLTINYNNANANSPFQDINLKKYSNFYKMEVSITAILEDVGGGPLPATLADASLRNFKVEASILTQHYDTKEYGSAPPATAPVVTSIPHPIDNYLYLSWEFSTVKVKPVNYELEWTYVDDYNVSLETGYEAPLPLSALRFNFQGNNTRVWLDDDNYRIPLIYSRGYVVYRVRAVRPDSILFKYPIYSAWSLPQESGGMEDIEEGYYYYNVSRPYTGDRLNWQYTTSFAEGGKYKNVVSFYDGLLKNRQSITRFNSSLDKLIATNNIYDFEGRLAIKTLPVPIGLTSFDFQHSLDLNAVTGAPYKAADFDTGSLHYHMISPLASGALASRYYSGQNPDTSVRWQKFVADAQGYPLVQTIFESGYNDRVSAQGGAGRALQIGTDNYISNKYVGADQPQLNALFGPNVGWKGFYTKTITTDPNQQRSMVIRDYHGKQFASALIGQAADPLTHALNPLGSANPKNLRMDVLAPGPGSQAVDSLAGTIRADIDYFSGSHAVDTLQYAYAFTPFPVCDGHYLSVRGHYQASVTDAYGNVLLSQDTILGANSVSTSAVPYDYTCGAGTFTADMDAYHVSKTLTFSPADVREVLDTFFAGATCFLTEPYFVRKSVVDAQFPCVGTPIAPLDDSDECVKMRWEMMRQLFPNGVYGHYRLNGTQVRGTSNSIYTIFGCPTDTFQVGARYGDSVLLHCYDTAAYAILGGDSSSILASQHELGIVNYRCFCASLGITSPSTCLVDSNFSSTVTITLPDLFDSTKIVYFPFVPSAGGMEGNFMIRCDNWNLATMNSPIYDGSAAVGSVYTTLLPGGHSSTVITLPVAGSGDMYSANLHGVSAAGAPLDFVFSGHMRPGHSDSMHHFWHFYLRDSMAVNYSSPLCTYRYQDTCTVPSLQDTITVGGNFYSGLRTMPAADFTMIYNQAIAENNFSIAEQLLPLHPQYCSLNNCFTDSFKTRITAIPDWRTADALGALRIDDLVAQDPLVGLLAASGMTGAADSLLTFPGGTKRLDSFVYITAYCACRDSIMFWQCYSSIFADAIANHLLVTADAKKIYFDYMHGSYFSNRQRFVDSLLVRGGNTCSHCASVRMNLVPGGAAFPVAVVIDTPAITFGGAAGGSNWLTSIFTDDESSVHDSTVALYHSEDSSISLAAIDTIVSHIANCIAGDVTLEGNIRTSLLALYTAGQITMGNFSYSQIRQILLDNGVELSDLCNPWVFDFSQHEATTAGNDCLPPSYFSDLNAFLQLHEVSDALSHTGSMYGPVEIDTFHNQVALEFSHRIGNVCTVNVLCDYDAAAHLYTINVHPVTGAPEVVKIFLHESADCADHLPADIAAGGIIGTECISTAPSLASGIGVINQYAFVTSVTPYGGGAPSCYYTCWMNTVRTMYHRDDDEVTAPCIPCTQMRTLYNRFTDTLQAYNIRGTDHPLYASMLTNFMNGALHQQYSSTEYETFIQSCALADSMSMPLYVGYSTFSFNTIGDMDAFINGLNDIDPEYNFDHCYRERPVGGTPITVCIDLNTVPVNKLWQYKSYLTGYPGSGIVNRPLADVQPPGQLGFVYVIPPPLPAPYFDPGTAGILDPAANIEFSSGYDKDIWVGGAFVKHRFYNLRPNGAGPVTTQDVSRAIYSTTAYLYNNTPSGVTFVPQYQSTIDADYFKPEKQEYLRYTYGFQALPDYQVLDSVQAHNLVARIPYYNAHYKAIYSRPQAPGIFTNLYLWNDGMNSRYYDTLKQILNYVSPSGAIFGTTPSISVSAVPAPAKLDAYICADKTYWYRYFTTGDTMFNVYLSFPAYIPPALRPAYSVVDIGPMPGDSANRYFWAKVARAGSADTVQLFGLTNFVINRSIELDNVLMRSTPQGINPVDTFDNCERQTLLAAVNTGVVNYHNYMDSVKDNVSGSFRNYAVRSVGEKLTLSYTTDEQQYTLYNYDRAGNLAWTEPPAGVVPIDDPAELVDVDVARLFNTAYTGPYTYNKRNSYFYNSYNNVTTQKTINGGATNFMYDAAGRLVFSQNAKQQTTGRYTYNLYDEQSRLMETGEAALPASITTTTAVIPYSSIVTAVHATTRFDVVMTIYDTAARDLGAMPALDAQQYLRKRVSCVKYFGKLTPADVAFANYNYATHYSYDPQGNVQTLVQDNPALEAQQRRYIRIDYDYDLISGKVNMLSYNRGWPEQFYQKYSYDADNRITEVNTSNDGYIWSREAQYKYYDHGPLARVVLGNCDMRVQGIDYAYTIQGWLKAMNTDTLGTAADMGRDGGSNSITARDAVAHTIDYFAGDYRAITPWPVQHVTTPVLRNLYNGNIARQTVAIDDFIKLNKQYAYDQLNRIASADYATVDPATGALNSITDFHNRYTYDADGNIQTLLRYGNNTGSGAQQMDSLHYVYPSIHNDMLADVYDSAANVYTNDLQQYTTPTAMGRYAYDPIGNMTADLVSGQDNIRWNLYNKVIQADNSTAATTLNFDYDGAGNRVGKHYTTTDATTGDATIKHEYYVHDASGNILATYKGKEVYPAAGGSYTDFALAEHNIYGSSRLGIKQYYGLEIGESVTESGTGTEYDTSRLYTRTPWYSLEYQDVIKTDSTNPYGNPLTDMYFAHHTVGQRQYELTDHLGNVLATISDKHAADSFKAIGSMPLSIGDDATVTAWKPIVISAHDYYPFGEYMPGRYKTDLTANCMTAHLQTLVAQTYTVTLAAYALGAAGSIVGSAVASIPHFPPFPPPPPYPILVISTSAVGSGVSFDADMSANGSWVSARVHSVSGDDTIIVKDDAGNYIGYLPITGSSVTTVPTTLTVPITVIPHSHNVSISMSSATATSTVMLIDVSYPRDTTTAYNIATNVCNNDFYRFGYNGKQKDNEWAGLGNNYDYGARRFDVRIARFISMDPLVQKFPWWSPYQFSGNNPIKYSDADGLEPKESSPNYGRNVMVGLINHKSLENSFLRNPEYGMINHDNNNWITGGGTDLGSSARFISSLKASHPNVKINNLVVAAHGGVRHDNGQSVLYYDGDHASSGSVNYITADDINQYKQGNTDGINHEKMQAISDLKTMVNSVEENGNLFLMVCNTAVNNIDLGTAIGGLSDSKINIYITPDKVVTGRDDVGHFPELDRRAIRQGIEFSESGRTRLVGKNQYHIGFIQISSGSEKSTILNKNIKYQSQGAPVNFTDPKK